MSDVMVAAVAAIGLSLLIPRQLIPRLTGLVFVLVLAAWLWAT